MEFFLQFFFQPISRAVRLTIGGPLPLTYSSLNSTLQRVSLTHFFLSFLHSFVPFFYIVSYIHISFHVEPIVEPIGHRGDWHRFTNCRSPMLLWRFVLDLECKPRYETKLSDQVNLFDSRMGERRRGGGGGSRRIKEKRKREKGVVLCFSVAWFSRILDTCHASSLHSFRFVIPSAPKDFQSLPLS